MDALVAALAVIGTVTGTIGATISILAYRRDRSQLVVYAHTVGTHADGGSYVAITVANKGKQPVTLREAGLLVSLDAPVPTELEQYVGVALVPREPHDPLEVTHMLGPGESVEFRYPGNRRLLLPYYLPLRAFARDVLGNMAYDYARPIFKEFDSLRWWPPNGTRPEFLAHPRAEIRDKQPPAKWRFWRRYDLYPESYRH